MKKDYCKKTVLLFIFFTFAGVVFAGCDERMLKYMVKKEHSATTANRKR